MRLQIDFTHHNAKINQTPKTFSVKEQDHKLISMRRNKRLTPPAKMTKWGMISIPVYQNARRGRECTRPSPVIMIKLSELVEDLFCQIKSMSRDDMIVP